MANRDAQWREIQSLARRLSRLAAQQAEKERDTHRDLVNLVVAVSLLQDRIDNIWKEVGDG
jgi:hypothetical protein